MNLYDKLRPLRRIKISLPVYQKIIYELQRVRTVEGKCVNFTAGVTGSIYTLCMSIRYFWHRFARPAITVMR